MRLGNTLLSLRMGFRNAIAGGSTLLSGLVSYWPLDEVSGVRYDVVGSNDLTDNNTVGAKLRGPEGTVASFVAANSESLTRASLGFDWTATWTLSLWVKFADSSAYYDFINVTGGPIRVYRAIATGNVTPSFNAAATNPASTYVADNEWTMLTFWHDGAGEYGYSVNNASPVTASGTQCGAGTNLFFGIYSDGGSNPFGGWMSEAAIHSRVLTSDERTALFAAGNGLRYADLPAGLLTGLVSWWELDEVSGVRYDSHGANDLTDNNTVGSVINAGDALDGGAASFVGVSSEFLSKSFDASLNQTGEVTYACWFKTAGGYDNFMNLMGFDYADAFPPFMLWMNNTVLQLAYAASAVDWVRFNPGDSSFSNNTWHHVIAWFDPADRKGRLQIDGGAVLEGAALSGSSLRSSSTEVWKMGQWSFGQYQGLIDEVAIWDRVLSSDERAELYALGAGKFYPFEA